MNPADATFVGGLSRWLLQALLVAVGLIGLGSVAAHAQSYTYVTNTKDDTLSMIYTATHEIKNPPVRAIISLKRSGDTSKYNPVATAVTPYSVAGNANGQFVYTVNKDVNSVSVVDTAKSQLVDSRPGAPNPIPINCLAPAAPGCTATPVAIAISGVRLNPVGGGCKAGNPLWRTFAYVTNFGDGTVSIIDTDPSSLSWNTVVKTLTVGKGPSAVAVSNPTLEEYEVNPGVFMNVFSAGFYVYVTNSLDSTVSVIDATYSSDGKCDSDYGLKFHSVISTLALKPAGENPTAIAFERYARWAYVTNFKTDNVSAIDACSGSITPGQGVCDHSGSLPLSFTPGFKVGKAIELDGCAVVARVPALLPPLCPLILPPKPRPGAKPTGIAITIDYTGSHKHQQARAYVVNSGDDSFSVLDVEAGSPPGSPFCPGTSWCQNPNFQIPLFLCEKDTLACLKTGDKPTGVSVMYPDEDFVYITNYGSNTVAVVDSDPDSLGVGGECLFPGDGCGGDVGTGAVNQYNHEVGRIKRGIGSPFPGVAGSVCQPLDASGIDANRWCGLPLGISNTPRVPYAYVMNSGSHSISVVGASPQIGDPHPILHTIPLTFSPTWVTLNRNQDFIFVADPVRGRVHVINTLGQVEVGATTEPMGIPLRLATPPDGWSAYVTSSDNNVYAVDTVDRSGPGGPGDPFVPGGGLDVSFPIPGTPGFAPMDVSLRRCSKRGPLDGSPFDPESPAICPIDGAKVKLEWDDGVVTHKCQNPQGVDVHPDDFRGFVACAGSNDVFIIDTHYNSLTWNKTIGRIPIPTGPGAPASGPVGVGFTHKGDRALVLRSDMKVSIINTTTLATIREVSVGKGPQAAAFSELDRHAYVTNSGDNSVSVIDMTGTSYTVEQVQPGITALGYPEGPWPCPGCTVGKNPQDVFINLGERVAAYVVNKDTDSISIIDAQHGNVLGSTNAPTFNTVIHTVKLPPGSRPVGIILTEP